MSDIDESDESPKEWLSPLDALNRINTILKNEARAQRAIITRLRNGQIKAVAALRSEGHITQHNVSMQKDAWGYFTGAKSQQDFWHVGDLRIYIRARKHGEHSRVIYFTTVSFDRAGIEALADSLPKSETEMSHDESIWLTPKETLEIVLDAVGNSAESIIMERLRGNLLQAVASRISTIDDGGDPEIAENCPIDAGLWQHIQIPRHFWDAAQVTFYMRDPIYGARTITCTDIRFLKKHVLRMFPNQPKKATPKELAALPASNPTEPNSKVRPVSDAALRAWFEAYRLGFSDAEDTEETAIASATGMFPGRSVSRQKIRNLRGSKKRGRKPGGGE